MTPGRGEEDRYKRRRRRGVRKHGAVVRDEGASHDQTKRV
jgi:hypothetical protein